eukprot:TRINITY_DN4871_c0_g4_i1.p1 TRINITY_DN4871_c0_g4~~TRINITY_DN4871_c0_g4_i1.p1  ORF type:complete len:158 (+),score=29.89 TRINITY_DN4871_c0_g4_i1:238-711(+)
MSIEMQTWESLNKRTRKLGNELTGKLASYSKMGDDYEHNNLLGNNGNGRHNHHHHHHHQGSHSGSHLGLGLEDGDEEDQEDMPLISGTEVQLREMELEIDNLLMQLAEALESLDSCAAKFPPNSGIPVSQTLQHHRERLMDFGSDFRKTKVSIDDVF